MASDGQAHGASDAAAGPAAADPFLLLTEELLVEVLRHVGDQRELLGSCALVSTAWRSAAVAACSSIGLQLPWNPRAAQARADGLCDWLAHSGASVGQLRLSGSQQAHLRLPLGRLPLLQQLSVEHFALLDAEQQQQQQPLQGDSSGRLGLAALTSLRLSGVQVRWRSGLAPLAACSALHELELWDVAVHTSEQQLGAQLCSLVQCQPQLTRLSLRRVRSAAEQCVSGAALAPSLSRLVQLRELELSCELTRASLAGLGACRQLTRLCMWRTGDADHQPQLTARSAPGLTQLIALQQLELNSAVLEPALLLGLWRLQHVSLISCSLQPQGAAGVAALLQALAAHTALELLALPGSLRALAPAPEAYSALTASTALTRLDLVECVLPPGCGRHLFLPGHRLPRLVQLDLVSTWDWQPPGDGEAAPPPLLGDGDVARLVACCPGLVDLTATPALAASLPVAELAKLSALTSLRLVGPLFDDAVARQLAAQLPSLQSLVVFDAGGFTDLGLHALTGLTGLTTLFACRCGLSGSVADEHGVVDLRAGKEPVWQQAQRCCAASPVCLTALLQQREQQLVGAQARIAQLEAQLAEAAQQLARR